VDAPSDLLSPVAYGEIVQVLDAVWGPETVRRDPARSVQPSLINKCRTTS
jgi:hypothetical protein